MKKEDLNIKYLDVDGLSVTVDMIRDMRGRIDQYDYDRQLENQRALDAEERVKDLERILDFCEVYALRVNRDLSKLCGHPIIHGPNIYLQRTVNTIDDLLLTIGLRDYNAKSNSVHNK